MQEERIFRFAGAARKLYFPENKCKQAEQRGGQGRTGEKTKFAAEWKQVKSPFCYTEKGKLTWRFFPRLMADSLHIIYARRNPQQARIRSTLEVQIVYFNGSQNKYHH